MLFSSRDRGQIERILTQLVRAGIRCEIRDFRVELEQSKPSTYSELWVEANTDYHTASILYASPIALLRQRAPNETS
jgi:hypothetical protein